MAVSRPYRKKTRHFPQNSFLGQFYLWNLIIDRIKRSRNFWLRRAEMGQRTGPKKIRENSRKDLSPLLKKRKASNELAWGHCKKRYTVTIDRNSPPLGTAPPWISPKSRFFWCPRLEQPPLKIKNFPWILGIRIPNWKKIKGTPLEFLTLKVISKMIVKNSPPLFKRDFRSQGGAVPVDCYCNIKWT